MLTQLTLTEQKVLNAACEGLNVRGIAAKLDIRYSTVRSHLLHIYQKRHVHSRSELVAQEWTTRELDAYMEALTC